METLIFGLLFILIAGFLLSALFTTGYVAAMALGSIKGPAMAPQAPVSRAA